MLLLNIDTVRINFDTGTVWVLNLALALVMFGIALDLSMNDFRELIRRPRAVWVGVSSQFILLPILTFLLVWSIDPYPSMALGMILVAACPGGNVSNFMSHLGGGNAALSVCLTAIATLLAVIMTPLNLQFWGSLYEPTEGILKSVSVSPLEMAQVVALLLAVPMALGIWVNTKWPRFARRMAKGFKIGSLLFFLILVALALVDNWDIFINYVAFVFGIVLLHNFLALGSGFLWAKIWRLQPRETRSITIETGIQNSGLGLLLIFTFFDGLGGMALLVAFWGIWHLVSGLILAGIWSRRPFAKKNIV